MPRPEVFRPVRLVACLFLLAGCHVNSTPIAPAHVESPTDVIASPGQSDGARLPFRGGYRTTGGALFAPGEPGSEPRCNVKGLLTITFGVEGKASHLGDFTGTASNCTAFPIPGPVAIEEGVFTISASNDDRLVGTYEGQQDAVASDGSAVFHSMSEITGGTGRFARATGEFTEDGVIDFNTGQTSATFEGWIAYDASDRRQ